MKIKILECSGDIRGAMRTSSLLIDDALIYAATGFGDLPLEVLSKIDHIMDTILQNLSTHHFKALQQRQEFLL